MTKIAVPALALCLLLTGCGWFGSKPAPAPASQPQPVAPPPPPAPEPAPAPLTHTVKKGESLGIIAKKYSVPAKKLMEANKIANAKYLKAGTVLTIPGKTVAGQVKPVAEKAPAKAAPEKEPVEKEVKGKKGKASKADPYGVEAATAPEKGKKKAGKVDDDATYEKIKAEFHEYAKKWLDRSNSLSEYKWDKREVKMEDGRYVATYSVILPETMQTEVKRVEYGDTPYVGHIMYEVEVHRAYGATKQEAIASAKDKDEVKRENMREIFSYSGQKRAWR